MERKFLKESIDGEKMRRNKVLYPTNPYE